MSRQVALVLGREVAGGAQPGGAQAQFLPQDPVGLGQEVQALLRRDAREVAQREGGPRRRGEGSWPSRWMPMGTVWIFSRARPR